MLSAVHTPPQQPWPAAQQLVPQAICVAVHGGLHAMVVALQPVEGQAVIIGVGQAPLALHTRAPVWTPALQVCPAPHAAPAPLFVVSTHIEAPVVQEVAPFLHGFAGWHA